MWLGNPTNYKHYHELSIMMMALMSDYAEWRRQRSFETNTVNADDRYSMPIENKGGFKALPLIDARKINEQLEDRYYWKRATTQFYHIPGAIDLCINMIRPGKMLPVHHDGYVWDWIRQSMGDPTLEGYTVSFGIDIPEPENQGLIFDGVEKIWKTGEFVAFNGHDIQHSLTNKSNNPMHWRVTAVMEIDKKEFNTIQ
jgi:hypothetical protein